VTDTNFPALSGERLELVALSDEGLPDMFAYSQDPRFYRFLEFEPHQTIDDTRQYLDRLRERSAGGNAYYWFVRRKADAKMIGTFGVHSIDWRKRSGEIGYGIAASEWGHGYFAEALQIGLRHLFATLEFHRVSATTPVENAASVRALLRAGFVQEGVLRDYYLSAAGRRYDAAVLALLAPEYDRRDVVRST
jgi:RimJ/RimL family protein N-acetyltransferase